MTYLFSNMKRQPGGLYTAVIPYNDEDAIYQAVFASIMEASTRAEAKGHGAVFDPDGFLKVLRALARKNSVKALRPVEGLIFVAAWDLLRPIFIGTNLNFRGLSMRPNGQNIETADGIVSEDVCLLRRQLVELAAGKPPGAWFPEGGIGKHFVKLCMQHYAEHGMNGEIFPERQLFEYAIDNTNIIRLQRELGAKLGEYPHSGLYRFKGLTPAIQDRLFIPMEPVWATLPDGSKDPDRFIMPWKSDSGRQQQHTSFTRGISSFTGYEVFQSEMVSAGEPLPEEMAKNIAASALKAGNRVILEEREERAAAAKCSPSPSIPLEGTTKEMYEAMFAYGGTELVTPLFRPANDDEVIYNLHVGDNPVLASAVGKMVPIRRLGDKIMQTGSLDLTEGMREASTLQTAKKLQLVRQSSGNPHFNLVAA